MLRILALLTLAAGFLPAAQPLAGKPKFGGAAALSYSNRATSFGQRPSGSDAIGKLRNWILTELKSTGAEVKLDSFTAFTPAGSLPMSNVVARFSGSSGKAIVITGHYDTKRIPLINFVGANDGGSSTGFLLELARVVSQQKRTDDVYIVWLDGEEAVAQWTASDSLYGSRHLAQKWFSGGLIPKIKALINVDMIGDKDLDLVLDSNSSSSLRGLVWEIAAKLGYGKYFQQTEGAIEDDHMPFIAAGVNALDLIDFDYGPQNSYWHTAKDTPDKLSAHSFQVVGDVLLETIARLQSQ
jgi:Zn-dependent M28 family amino/carboxypeptidase